MSKSIEDLLQELRDRPKNVHFRDLERICRHHFGEPRQSGSSHQIYKTPWAGDPRVNIQSDKGKAKAYQVRQVLRAIEVLQAEKKETKS